MSAELWKAIGKGDSEKVRELCSNAVIDINAFNKKGYNALHLAIQEGNAEVVDILLAPPAANKANANLPDNVQGWTPLIHSIANSKNGFHEIMASLVKYKADVNGVDLEGNSALHWASRMGQVSSIQFLLDRGTKKNVVGGSEKTTALHQAVAEGHDGAVELLLSRKFDVNAGDAKKNTPLHYAVIYGQGNIALLLLEQGANVNAQNEDGDTPLHLAYAEQKQNLANRFIAAGANVDIVNKEGRTPKDVEKHKAAQADDMRREKDEQMKEKLARKKEAQKADLDNEVAEWLKELGLSQYIEVFARRKWFFLEDLLHIKDETLKRVNVAAAHRRQILEALEKERQSIESKMEEVKKSAQKEAEAAPVKTYILSVLGAIFFLVLLYLVFSWLAAPRKEIIL
eukprot:GILJ01005154.1.p1 GENE.GILJ01005154.1~~GILJ01005154.1.p1  ORF type:complete len:430 (+),score=87.51 GILJ01005154.1:95-1291(+)